MINPPYDRTLFEDKVMLPFTNSTCPAFGATVASADVSQPLGQSLYLMLPLVRDSAYHAPALLSWSIVPCDAKNPLVTPDDAFWLINVGLGVLVPSPSAQGAALATAPLHVYVPPAM